MPELRTIRTKNNIPNKDQLELAIMVGDKGFAPEFNSVLVKMGNLSALNVVTEEVKLAASFLGEIDHLLLCRLEEQLM